MAAGRCETDSLKLLLADQLSASRQQQLSEHVAHCRTCQQQLEQFAGDAGWWSEVASCFRTHAIQLTSTTAVAGSGGVDADLDEAGFAADFVVDFLEAADHPEALGRLGDYEILEVIGRGGMGVVLKGYQRDLARYVAVKMMAPHLASSGAARQRFVREARAAAAILHPHVMPIHSVCTSARLPYLVMPYLACESLQQRIDARGPLELTEILRIGMQAAQGLAASHAQGLVHRDIKPANILLEKNVDRVMLVDFGLARAADDASLTRTGLVAGTPQYMSPEQACGNPLDARSDLFSLGSVLYALCTGRPPFCAETALAVLRRVTDTQPHSLRDINPVIPEWLEHLIVRLLEKSPDRRISSAQEVADLLQHCLAHVQHPTTIPLPARLQRTALPRRRIWIGAIGLSVVATVGVCLLRQFQPPPPAADAIPESASPSITSALVPSQAATSDTGSFRPATGDGAEWDFALDQWETTRTQLESLESRAQQTWETLNSK